MYVDILYDFFSEKFLILGWIDWDMIKKGLLFFT